MCCEVCRAWALGLSLWGWHEKTLSVRPLLNEHTSQSTALGTTLMFPHCPICRDAQIVPEYLKEQPKPISECLVPPCKAPLLATSIEWCLVRAAWESGMKSPCPLNWTSYTTLSSIFGDMRPSHHPLPLKPLYLKLADSTGLTELFAQLCLLTSFYSSAGCSSAGLSVT